MNTILTKIDLFDNNVSHATYIDMCAFSLFYFSMNQKFTHFIYNCDIGIKCEKQSMNGFLCSILEPI
jgi:hypothetical protein